MVGERCVVERLNLNKKARGSVSLNRGISHHSPVCDDLHSAHTEAVWGRGAEMICLFPLCGKAKKSVTTVL